MKDVIEQLQGRILDAEPASALVQAQVYGALLWAVDLGIYDAVGLERYLVDRCASQVTLPAAGGEVRGCLHVVSEPYMQGGHTRLMERLARMHEEPVDLLVARSAKPEVLERLAGYFEHIEVARGDDACARLQSIIDTLARYDKVVLHIHPDDIITTVACGLLKQQRGAALTVYFVNHADHVFSFGAAVADVYFEISAYGHHLDKKKHLACQKSFLAIPIETSGAKVPDAVPVHERIKVFSAASAAKYKPHRGLDMRPSIIAILERFPTAECWIIGANPLTNTWWWTVKLRYPTRFFIRRHLPYKDYLAFAEQADFYLDSYPIPGGTAFAEQLLKGQRCVGLVAPIQGYSPADSLKVASIDQLLTSIEQPRPSAPVVEAVQRVNSLEAVKARYLACIERGEYSDNELAALLPWTGNLDFMKPTGKVTSMIPADVLDALGRIDTRLALRTLLSYAWVPRIKLLIKVTLYRLARLPRARG
ncbi:hypothetical protein C6A77_03445 [Pseudomonas sp. AFG_SD02_1510_Pfu_092]|uniref:hypothetical protein n=1 Tax=Pseudomonas sp. AFG_SD02_1510_Pfu_092 TaxID=2259497 RepID=UPI000DEF52B0|nr:hypothetical protein [Pseudomonas sp. AFG_SD02_1510_Pfu_092]RCL29123.1 hypothetical protein C6A77_03445 [Pseudomonas sp. AFG_SD02_1510_Pfu_092]